MNGDARGGIGDSDSKPVTWVVKKLAYIARNSRGSAQLAALRVCSGNGFIPLFLFLLGETCRSLTCECGLQRKAAFEYFATLTTLLGKEGIQPLLTTMLSPVHRVVSVDTDYRGVCIAFGS